MVNLTIPFDLFSTRDFYSETAFLAGAAKTNFNNFEIQLR